MPDAAPMRTVAPIGAGLSARGVRDHNERLVLSLLRRHGALPGSDIARRADLSPPTVSAILRRLAADGLLEPGEPPRGRVGKPARPMRLAPGGALSWGFKIGRRSAELILMDLGGIVRAARALTYATALPGEAFAFLDAALAEVAGGLAPEIRARICGIGIAAPFEMWTGTGPSHRPDLVYDGWHGIDLRQAVEDRTGLSATLANDATAACQAEQIFGRDRAFRDFAYFFVGAYVGGGIVLNDSVYAGRRGNAGALGSLPTVGPGGAPAQLIDRASIFLLERALRDAGVDPAILWRAPQDWSGIAAHVRPWLDQVAGELARAAVAACAVVDFEAVVIDGAFPPGIRDALTARIREAMPQLDARGLLLPRIEAGSIGANARAIGAASGPLFAQFMLNTNAGMATA